MSHWSIYVLELKMFKMCIFHWGEVDNAIKMCHIIYITLTTFVK